MIRKLLRRVFKRTEATSSAELAIIPVDRHGLRREQLSPAARKVCAVLQERGYKAYVVGGAVRDLLAGLTPKDLTLPRVRHPNRYAKAFDVRESSADGSRSCMS